jgi:hypothetical protein
MTPTPKRYEVKLVEISSSTEIGPLTLREKSGTAVTIVEVGNSFERHRAEIWRGGLRGGSFQNRVLAQTQKAGEIVKELNGE